MNDMPINTMTKDENMITKKKAAILEAIEEIGRPVIAGDIRRAVKEKGFDVCTSSLTSTMASMAKAGYLKRHPGNKKLYAMYGLPHQEMPEDLDRRIPAKVLPPLVRWEKWR